MTAVTNLTSVFMNVHSLKARHSGCVNQVVNTKACLGMMASTAIMMVVLLLLPLARAGVNDTVDQLRNGFTIVPLSDQVYSTSHCSVAQVPLRGPSITYKKLIIHLQLKC